MRGTPFGESNHSQGATPTYKTFLYVATVPTVAYDCLVSASHEWHSQ
jgi:hypothetical protein